MSSMELPATNQCIKKDKDFVDVRRSMAWKVTPEGRVVAWRRGNTRRVTCRTLFQCCVELGLLEDEDGKE